MVDSNPDLTADLDDGWDLGEQDSTALSRSPLTLARPEDTAAVDEGWELDTDLGEAPERAGSGRRRRRARAGKETARTPAAVLAPKPAEPVKKRLREQRRKAMLQAAAAHEERKRSRKAERAARQQLERELRERERREREVTERARRDAKARERATARAERARPGASTTPSRSADSIPVTEAARPAPNRASPRAEELRARSARSGRGLRHPAVITVGVAVVAALGWLLVGR